MSRISSVSVAMTLALCVAAAALAEGKSPSSRPATAAKKTKVIVVPMQGPLYYHLASEELAKIVRGVAIQKPEAVVFVFSSSGGSEAVAFDLAEQIAGLTGTRTVAYVSGGHGGAFAAALVPVVACKEVFAAPGNRLGPSRQAEADAPGSSSRGPQLSDRQLSLLQAWAEANGHDWEGLKAWFRPVAGPASRTAASQPASGGGADPSGPAAQSEPARSAATNDELERRIRQSLHVRKAANLDDLLRMLGLAEAWRITWPDPVARTNEQMRRIFLAADGLVKKIKQAIEAAKRTDPRSFRYELRDLYTEYSVGTIVPIPETDIAQEYRQSTMIVDRSVFADGGAAWRANTDRCVLEVRKALRHSRQLMTMLQRYPELDIDRNELSETIADLAAWYDRLKQERNLKSPP